MTVTVRKSLNKGPGYKDANILLKSMWENSVDYSKNFLEFVEGYEMPFQYSERSSASALIAGLAASGACVLPEVPCSRKVRGKPVAYGRIDAWASTEQYEYYIEFKHCWYNIANAKEKARYLVSWKTMNSQMKSARAPLKKMYANTPFWQLGMMIVPVHRDGKSTEKARSVHSEWENVLQQSRPFVEADWIGEWAIEDDVATFDYSGETTDSAFYSYQPKIYLLAKAEFVK